jgi:hypothetical protein
VGLRRFLDDPAHCRHIEQRNRERAQAFSWDAIASRYHRVYESALSPGLTQRRKDAKVG